MRHLQLAILLAIYVLLALPIPTYLVLRRLQPSGLSVDRWMNRSLKGMSAPDEEYVFTSGNWFSGRFQQTFTKWANRNFAGRELAIRAHNQILWELAEKSYMANGNIISGKHTHLFERPYLEHYNFAGGLMSDSSLDSLAGKMREVSNRLRARGVTFVVLFTPNKAMIHPDAVPERFTTNLSAGKQHNLDRLLPRLRKAGVPVVNGAAITAATAHALPASAFPETGTHWSAVTAFPTAEALIREVEARSGRRLARMERGPISVDNQPASSDNDLALLLNLYKVPTTRYMHAPVRIKSGDPKRTGRLTIVGGSFVGQLIQLWEAGEVWESITYYYYFKVELKRYPGAKIEAVDVPKIDWDKDFLQRDAVVLEINENAINGAHPTAFLDAMLLALHRSPGDAVPVHLPSAYWYGLEKRGERTWQWSRGDADVELQNTTGAAIKVAIRFGLVTAAIPRDIVIRDSEGHLLWQGALQPNSPPVQFQKSVVLPPGRSVISFQVSPGAKPASSITARQIAFAIYDLTCALETNDPSQ